MPDDQIRIASLDAKKFETFANAFGSTIDSELEEWISTLCSADRADSTFERLNTLAWYIFVERQGAAFGEPSRFQVTRKLAAFQEFVYTFNAFSTMTIPDAHWSDVADQMIRALMEEASSGVARFDSPGCLEAQEFARGRLQEIADNPKYAQRFTDLLNGAI